MYCICMLNITCVFATHAKTNPYIHYMRDDKHTHSFLILAVPLYLSLVRPIRTQIALVYIYYALPPAALQITIESYAL